MPFGLCTSKNKEDKRDPPYSRKQNRNIEDVVDDSKALLDEQKDKVKVAKRESENLKSELERLKEQLEKANAKLAEQSKSIEDKATSGLDDLKAEVQEYKQKLQDSENAKQTLEKEKVELEKTLKNASDTPSVPIVTDITNEVTSKLENELQNLQNVKEKAEKERSSIQKKLNDKEESFKIQLSQLESQIDKLKKEKEDTEEKSKSYKREKDSIENTLAHTKKELELAKKESHIPRSPTGAPSDEWMTKLKAAETELIKERDQRLEKEKDLIRLQSEKDQLSKEREDIHREYQNLNAKTEDMKKNLENAERNHQSEVGRVKEEYKRIIADKDEQNDHLLTRLSKATAAKVLDGNPNVSDLSDPNRPQKLGEQMSTLYDDEWTDACEELEKLGKFEDKDVAIPTTILELLKTVYNHCKEASENQLSRIEEHIFLPPLENAQPASPDTNGTEQIPVKSPTTKSASKIPRYASLSGRTGCKIPRFSSHKSRPALPNLTPGKKTVESEAGKDKDKKIRSNTSTKVKGEKVPEVPVEVRKGIKDYRKQVAKQVIPVIEKEVLHKLRNSPDFGEDIVKACLTFITKSVEICWLMCIQDPPVCLKWDIPSDYSFDTDLYRAYTKTGSHINYLVWPVTYLYDGGSVLLKGVAQAKAS